jgi:uncharacterized protein
MKIAVIGGGIGGLAVAYNLIAVWQAAGSNPATRPDVTVFEKSGRFGGNADTVQFSLGTDPNGNSINRWADLGVNDFNATAYVEIVKVMNRIGYTEGVNYTLLEDTTSYYTLDGSVAYTLGGDTSSVTAMPAALSDSVDGFMTQAAQDALLPQFASYTVEQYITEQGPIHGWDARLGPQVIYPRVNGMYFTDEVAPSALPLRAVMHYYMIQEGAGGGAARRMYFIGGASTWIAALTAYMTQKLGIKLVADFQACMTYGGQGWSLYRVLPGGGIDAQPLAFDAVVIATHADDALKLFLTGASPGVVDCLSRISYLNGLSVAHTWCGMMPSDVNAWKTYNILIHQPPETTLKPYTISYVCNRHQNDAQNPAYNYFGGPQFFITVNPPLAIPSQYVLQDQTTLLPAIANLRHNILDFACLAAQETMQTLQGANSLYFAGGWTNGAGLHEECWVQGENIASLIVTGQGKPENHYDSRPGAKHFAPAYLRRLAGGA